MVVSKLLSEDWDRINFSHTADLCFDDGYVGKQPVAWMGLDWAECWQNKSGALAIAM